MASLHEYFVRDGSQNLTTQQSWTLTRPDGSSIGEAVARLHLDFDANAKYISFYIPALDEVDCPEVILLNALPDILSWRDNFVWSTGFESERMEARDLVFTGRVYLYSEQPVAYEPKKRMLAEAKAQRLNLVFRSIEYITDRNKWEKPRAFVSHDSRDKTEIAEPLVVELQKSMCPVSYDEFSLKVGDSLRESIEKGLKECSKCIFILTPNFLSNGGWSKREYDSIFTRELVEGRNVILPVWHSVSRGDVYKYSPILADRYAVQWCIGVEVVARKLLGAIDS
jgi:hypothetical protein